MWNMKLWRNALIAKFPSRWRMLLRGRWDWNCLTKRSRDESQGDESLSTGVSCSSCRWSSPSVTQVPSNKHSLWLKWCSWNFHPLLPRESWQMQHISALLLWLKNKEYNKNGKNYWGIINGVLIELTTIKAAGVCPHLLSSLPSCSYSLR